MEKPDQLLNQQSSFEDDYGTLTAVAAPSDTSLIALQHRSDLQLHRSDLHSDLQHQYEVVATSEDPLPPPDTALLPERPESRQAHIFYTFVQMRISYRYV